MSINFTKIYKNYHGRWVALSDNEKKVVGSGQTAKAALDAAMRKGNKKPILFRVPDKLVPYVGSAFVRQR